uniref:Secreted protein n=1 Tax=Caenorhabditis japonica TaxID=281687 RepID=A0A8R1EV94_CAEJA
MQYFVVFTMIITSPISFTLSIILDCILGKEDADDSPVDVDSAQLDGMREENQNNHFNEANIVCRPLASRVRSVGLAAKPVRECAGIQIGINVLNGERV